jgi:UDP-N-acetylmuramoylalanine--D-glutamate ligase
VLIGENKNILRRAIGKIKTPIAAASTLEKAVRAAYGFAKKLPSAAVVLSPGSQSFDMFRSYADRGDQFKNTVRKLK